MIDKIEVMIECPNDTWTSCVVDAVIVVGGVGGNGTVLVLSFCLTAVGCRLLIIRRGAGPSVVGNTGTVHLVILFVKRTDTPSKSEAFDNTCEKLRMFYIILKKRGCRC